MILYDFECTSCSNMSEQLVKSSDVETVLCVRCGGVARKKLTTRQTSNASFFPAGWFEGITWDPLYISSRRQLRDECERYGCYSKYLDGYAGWR